HGAHFHGLALADLLEDSHAQCLAPYLRGYEDFDYARDHRGDRFGIRGFSGRHRLSDQARRRAFGYAADAGGGHGAERQRACALRDHRRRGKLGRVLAAAVGGHCGWRRMIAGLDRFLRCRARLKAEAEKSNIARYRYRPERSAFNDNSSAFFPEAFRRHCGGVRWLVTWGTRDRVRRRARKDDLAMAAARHIQLRIRREQDGLLAKARP